MPVVSGITLPRSNGTRRGRAAWGRWQRRVGRCTARSDRFLLGSELASRISLRYLCSMALQPTMTPIDGSIYVERVLANGVQIENALPLAIKVQRPSRAVALEQRVALWTRLVEIMVADTQAV